MADVNEQMDDMLGSSYADDTTTKMPSGFEKVQRRLRAEDRGDGQVFVDKEDADEKIQSHLTGMAVGSAAIPSDAITMASEASKFVNKDPMLSTMFPVTSNVSPYLEEVNKLAGRPGFEELIKALGIKSDPTNTNQIVGEILSPSFYFPAFKGAVKLSKAAGKAFDDLGDIFKGGDGTGGAKLATESATSSNVGKASQIDDFNQPIINLSEVGIKAPDGLAASKTYEKLETDAMGGSYSEEKYKNLSLDKKDKLYRETGVYRGQDGKLRYKIPTADFQFNEGYLKDLGVIDGGFNSKNIPAEGITLEQMLNAKDLYRNYASVASNGDYGLLKDIRVKNFDSYIKENKLSPEDAMTELDGTQAIYSRHEGGETIYVRGGLKSNVRDDLLHEIQHAIQHREGFNAGSSPNRFLTDMSTELGQRYKNTLQDVYTEKRNALSTFEQTVVGGKRTNIDFLQNKELFESVTDKLVKREYTTLLETYNKTNADGYFDELPAGIRYLQRKDMLVDPPMIVRGESRPFVYQGYDTRNVKFNDNERNLANILSDNPSFQEYVRERIIVEHKARNLKLMEAVAHKDYVKVPGEVQARKIVEDDIAYRKIIKQLKDEGRPIPTDPQERDELIQRIFRRIMKPSEKGVLQGQGVKVDSGGNTTSPLDGDEMSVTKFPNRKQEIKEAGDINRAEDLNIAHTPMYEYFDEKLVNDIRGGKHLTSGKEEDLLLYNLSSKIGKDPRMMDLHKTEPFSKFKEGDTLRLPNDETVKIDFVSSLPVTDKKLFNNPNVIKEEFPQKTLYSEPVYLFKEADGSVAYYRLTDIDGAKKIGKPNLSIVEGEQ